ncbi:MAG: zinc-ribbon domain-containing protein [Holosporaceae bacterium]|jgi:predicted Zn finger-like uncharacterized protein|nr:zinc-ribbon domain-containing protein [Holosporaceae bacterium]
MIVVCPSCSCKYFVQTDVIGKEKLVRCSICGATWQQIAIDEAVEKRRHVFNLIKWTFFGFVVFVTIFSLFFAPNSIIKIWPPVVDFYETLGIQEESRKLFVIQNLSNFFVVRNNILYMGLRGELVNTSDAVKSLTSITISLKNDENVAKDFPFKKVWTHSLTHKKLLPNQKVVFETELQSVPYNNLICDIKLDYL